MPAFGRRDWVHPPPVMEVVTPEATEGEGKSGDAASGAGVVTPLPTATRTNATYADPVHHR